MESSIIRIVKLGCGVLVLTWRLPGGGGLAVRVKEDSATGHGLGSSMAGRRSAIAGVVGKGHELIHEGGCCVEGLGAEVAEHRLRALQGFSVSLPRQEVNEPRWYALCAAHS